MDLSATPLIPKPVNLTATGSSFQIKDKVTIVVHPELAAGASIKLLTSKLGTATGFDVELLNAEEGQKGAIFLGKSDDETLGKGGYELNITENSVSVLGYTDAGVYWGVQTLRHLFAADIESGEKQSGPWRIATGTIRDVPKYDYRGAMLDVARHFFSVEDVKQYIDYIAQFKMNVLHLHLTDDQGWRIEIKSWPNLTAHGGKTEVGGGEGGFYTQEEYTDIVKYAEERFIMTVPEIDMPGHTNSALASYPELNCDGVAPDLYTGIEVGFSTLCVDKELTYKFIDDVVKEMVTLTPGPYIHVGGDESHATELEDYLIFINKVQDIVKNNGKTMVGWDETAQANLSEGSVVQLWANEEFAREAVGKGAKLIMSPASRTYMDMQYDSTTELGLHWAGYIEIDHGYAWDPNSLFEGISNENILGVEAPLWSETVTNMDEIEYMIFPRLPGYSEIGWSGAGDWEEYKIRLKEFESRFIVQDINFYRSNKVWEPM